MTAARIALTVVSLAIGGVLADSAVAAKKPAAAAKAPAKARAKAKKAAAAPKKKAVKPAKKRTTRARRRGSRRLSSIPRQSQPTKERLTEIQAALIEQGYFSGEANGEWKTDSIEALKRFQNDQALQPSGKINSLSLIALGLGPKRNPLNGPIPVVSPVPAAAPAETEEHPDEAAEPPVIPAPAER
jgi:hypothetical protein